jgi:hypothetical protein
VAKLIKQVQQPGAATCISWIMKNMKSGRTKPFRLYLLTDLPSIFFPTQVVQLGKENQQLKSDVEEVPVFPPRTAGRITSSSLVHLWV